MSIVDSNVCFCSRLVVNYVTLAVGEVLLLILTVCSLAAIFPKVRECTKINKLKSINILTKHNVFPALNR